jgi:hypothetical protein
MKARYSVGTAGESRLGHGSAAPPSHDTFQIARPPRSDTNAREPPSGTRPAAVIRRVVNQAKQVPPRTSITGYSGLPDRSRKGDQAAVRGQRGWASPAGTAGELSRCPARADGRAQAVLEPRRRPPAPQHRGSPARPRQPRRATSPRLGAQNIPASRRRFGQSGSVPTDALRRAGTVRSACSPAGDQPRPPGRGRHAGWSQRVGGRRCPETPTRPVSIS